MSDPVETLPDKKLNSGSMKIVIKAVLIVLLMVGAEVIAAAYFLPSGHDAEVLARELAAAKAGAQSPGTDDSQQAVVYPDKPMGEFLLGAFNVTKYNPETEKTLVIDFELYAAVALPDSDDFVEQLESNRNRLREQVIMTLHGAETTDLSEAGLGLIKRKILEKTNRALGKPLVQEILLSKFNFVER